MDFDPLYKRIFRTSEEIETDLHLVVKLKTETDWTWSDITRHLNDRQGIGYVVREREIRQQYHGFIRDNTKLIDKDLERLSLLEDLDRLYQVAYEGYEASKKAKGTLKKVMDTEGLPKTSRALSDLETNLREVTKTTKHKPEGDSAFLNFMVKVIQEKAALLGVKKDAGDDYNPNNIPAPTKPDGINAPVTSQRQLMDMYKDVRNLVQFEEAEEIQD